jgi:2-(1,2-epoxy-1,2-dihydrophenyl)acetyl-CoA isomerase
VKDRIATITLNRPDKMNAFTGPMIERWAASLQEAQRDPNVNVVIVTGAGKAFCSGGDVGRMGTGDPTPLDNKNGLWEHIHNVPRTLEAMDKPVIAMVNGVTVGAGMGMSLMCDMRIASDAARFSTGYVRVGLVPGDGDTYFLPRLIGTARALELLWTADFIEAPRALELGIVNRVVPHDKLAEETYAFARRVADGPQAGSNDQAAGLPVHAARPAHPPRPGVVAHGGARDRGPPGRRAGLQGEARAEVQGAVARGDPSDMTP